MGLVLLGSYYNPKKKLPKSNILLSRPIVSPSTHKINSTSLKYIPTIIKK
jgi:hypothetical protein